MAKTVYIRTGLTGGASGDLDEEDGANLLGGDPALVFTAGNNILYPYENNASSSGDNSPDIIPPATNPGDNRWILQGLRAEHVQTTSGITIGQDLTVTSGGTIGGSLVAQSGVTITGGVSVLSFLNVQSGATIADGLTVNGTKYGLIDEIAKSTTATLTIAEVSGVLINNFGQTTRSTLTLPIAAEGYNFIAQCGTSGVSTMFKADSDTYIILDGIALDDADKVSIELPALGDHITFWTIQSGTTTFEWIASSGIGDWIDGGA